MAEMAPPLWCGFFFFVCHICVICDLYNCRETLYVMPPCFSRSSSLQGGKNIALLNSYSRNDEKKITVG